MNKIKKTTSEVNSQTSEITLPEFNFFIQSQSIKVMVLPMSIACIANANTTSSNILNPYVITENNEKSTE